MAAVLLVSDWPILRTWHQGLKGPEGWRAKQYRNQSQYGGLKFSTVTYTSRLIGLIADVCMQATSLLLLVNTYIPY